MATSEGSSTRSSGGCCAGVNVLGGLFIAVLEVAFGFLDIIDDISDMKHAGKAFLVLLFVMAVVFFCIWIASRVSDQAAARAPEVGASPCSICDQPLAIGAMMTACGECGSVSHQGCFQRSGCRSPVCLGVKISPREEAAPEPEPSIALAARDGASRCPYCRDDLQEAAATSTCPSCQTSYHSDCLAEAGCTTLGCSLRRESPTRT